MTKLVVEVEGEVETEEVVKEVVKEKGKKVVKEIPQPKKTPFKKIADLNDEEKKQIIDSIKAGKESEHYELKEFKNGTFRIVKKKQPTYLEKVVANTKSKDKSDPEKIYLTNDQLMNQRISDLEIKYTKLEGKYKKQKKRVNDIYENIEEDFVQPEIQTEGSKDASDSQPPQQQQVPPQPPRALSLRALRFRRY